MNQKLAILLCLFFTITILKAYSPKAFDKTAFYSAIASEDLNKVEAQLKILKKSSIREKKGYQGALLMKKAGLVYHLGEKLSLFKAGHKKLEEAIKEDPENTEFRFLRLIIQENAPSILNYNAELEQDSLHIKKSFNRLPLTVQKVIRDYSRKSEILTSI